MKFSVIHASRGRPFRALTAAVNTLNSASGGHEIEYILVHDADDAAVEHYRGIFDDRITKVEEPTGTVVSASNLGCAKATGQVLVFMYDYLEYPSCWDSLIHAAVRDNPSPDFVLDVNDGDPRANYWCIVPICSTSYYKRRGYVFNPCYDHYYSDVEFYDVAALDKVLIPAKHIELKFHHYAVNPTTKIDATYMRSAANMGQDQRIYQARKAGGFK